MKATVSEVAPQEMDRFRHAIRLRLGLQFDETGPAALAEVLRSRVDASTLDVSAYLSRLEEGARWSEEISALARALTVGETYFFRNSAQFRALRDLVLPARARARLADQRIRILSAGCASGEEAYSLAIATREIPELLGLQVSIRGLDVNAAALDRAASARYSAWALRETSPETRHRYFREDGRDFVLAPEIRAAVTFEDRNLVDTEVLSEPGTLDVVFCRNVLMYFAPEVARTVVARFARGLAPGGYLFLGHAETLRGISQDFDLCHTHETFYYRRRGPEPVAARDPAIPSASDGFIAALAPSSAASADRDRSSWVSDIERASARVHSLTAGLARPSAPGATTASVGSKARSEREAYLSPVVELMREERFAEARVALENLPAAWTSDPDVLLLRAVLVTHGGDLAAAERLCGEVLRCDENSVGAHYLTALCRAGEGDEFGAAEHDRRAIDLDPSFAMPRLHLGLLARKRRDRSTARRELSQAMTLLANEDPSRLQLFGGGFGRQSLIALCRAELALCGEVE